MKSFLLASSVLLAALCMNTPAKSQSQELQQLVLNLEKLNQLRAILDQMYQGYEIVSKGYNTIKDLSQGNFDLHKAFLNKLLAVNPTVKKYKRVAQIISLQRNLVREYKTTLDHFRADNSFDADDLKYFQQVYANLFDRSIKNLDELLMVITANQLRMNDAERLAAIDRIYADMEDKVNFLRVFNERAIILSAQKKRELQDTKALHRLYGITE